MVCHRLARSTDYSVLDRFCYKLFELNSLDSFDLIEAFEGHSRGGNMLLKSVVFLHWFPLQVFI